MNRLPNPFTITITAAAINTRLEKAEAITLYHEEAKIMVSSSTIFSIAMGSDQVTPSCAQ